MTKDVAAVPLASNRAALESKAAASTEVRSLKQQYAILGNVIIGRLAVFGGGYGLGKLSGWDATWVSARSLAALVTESRSASARASLPHSSR